MDLHHELNDTFLKTIIKSELGSVIKDLTEVSVDTFIKDGILKDIPIFGTIIGLYKGTIAIRDHIFLKKIIHFLSAIKDVPVSTRSDLFTKLESEGHNLERIGETLLLILDNIDNYNKARLLGLLLKALSNAKIDYNDFERFSSMIANIFIQDLLDLPKYVTELTTNTGSHLEAYSLILRKSLWVNEYSEANTYSLSRLGERFCIAIEIL